ncbi:hypothetical protein [Anaerolinea thermophila]|uniref:hypothetical protein n=3 Tax=Anaerolinea TaxID=233189 RepID=UPI0026EED43E|nr:hypothetical protein [Anaerolinea thermophila]
MLSIRKSALIMLILTLMGSSLLALGTHQPQAVQAEPLEPALATPRVHITVLAPTPVSENVSAVAPQGEVQNLAPAANPQSDAQTAPQSQNLQPQAAPPDDATAVLLRNAAILQEVIARRAQDPSTAFIYKFMQTYQTRGDGGGCAAVWEIVPDYASLPNWLTTPSRPEHLYSKISLYFLAAMLIKNKAVDASGCANGGLSTENEWVANNCGLSVAYAAVVQWQNRFNEVILNVAQETGVPAQLMKNIFSRESQFWPGIYFLIQEAGLGQLTPAGADTLLLWNPFFYEQFCPQVLLPEVCRKGYTNLTFEEQELLRGALMRMVDASCPLCPGGIDPYQSEFSVRVFAENLIANCNQVGQIIYNVTGKKANRTSSYVDLWQFTLVNYHAGPGCLTSAIETTAKANMQLTWDLVSANLPPSCRSAKLYVEEIIYMPAEASPPAPLPTATPTPTPAP